jgi:hypothetical protein
LQYKANLLALWDKTVLRVVAVSRASFERELPEILRGWGARVGTTGAAQGSVSRAEFSGQPPEISGK